MARTSGPIPKAPELQDLLNRNVPRERAVLAIRVGELRASRGWTHYGLGQRAEIHGTYLRQLEKGERDPGLDLLLRLARAFELKSLEQLFGALPTEPLL